MLRRCSVDRAINSETYRLLATYGLEEVQKRYLYGVDPDPEEWGFELKLKVSSRKAPFLAHAIIGECTKLPESLGDPVSDTKPGARYRYLR